MDSRSLSYGAMTHQGLTSSAQVLSALSGSGCYARQLVVARCSPFQQVAQVTGRGCFGYLGRGLVLSGADTVLETPCAAIEQAVIRLI